MHTIHTSIALSGIWTHSPSVRVSEDSFHVLDCAVTIYSASTVDNLMMFEYIVTGDGGEQ
jgi:hypothetical protein